MRYKGTTKRNRKIPR